MNNDTATLDYAANVLHVSLQTAKRMAKRGQIEDVIRPPGTQKWIVHIPTFDRAFLMWVEDGLERVQSNQSSSVIAVGSGKIATPRKMDARYAALLGPKRLAKRGSK